MYGWFGVGSRWGQEVPECQVPLRSGSRPYPSTLWSHSGVVAGLRSGRRAFFSVDSSWTPILPERRTRLPIPSWVLRGSTWKSGSSGKKEDPSGPDRSERPPESPLQHVECYRPVPPRSRTHGSYPGSRLLSSPRVFPVRTPETPGPRDCRL